MKKVLLVVTLILLNFVAKAQHKIPVISAQDKDQIEAQADIDVQNFCFYLTDLADKKVSSRQKDTSKARSLRLFADNATIVVKSNPNDPGKAHTVLEYLTQVGNYNYRNKLKVIAITFDQIIVDVNPENLRDTIINGRHAYVGKFSFLQHFRVQQEQEAFTMAQDEFPGTTKSTYTIQWGDDTRKYGKIIIIPKKAAIRGANFKVLLGDITAGEVIMVKKKRIN